MRILKGVRSGRCTATPRDPRATPSLLAEGLDGEGVSDVWSGTCGPAPFSEHPGWLASGRLAGWNGYTQYKIVARPASSQASCAPFPPNKDRQGQHTDARDAASDPSQGQEARPFRNKQNKQAAANENKSPAVMGPVQLMARHLRCLYTVLCTSPSWGLNLGLWARMYQPANQHFNPCLVDYSMYYSSVRSISPRAHLRPDDVNNAVCLIMLAPKYSTAKEELYTSQSASQSTSLVVVER